jgi:anaerobic selenocysteine-containing dehydrogenase
VKRSTRGVPEAIVDLLLRTGPHRTSLRKLREAMHGVDLGPLAPSRERCVRTEDGRMRLAPASLVADVPRLSRWVDAARDARGGGALVLVGRRHLRSNNSWMHNLASLAKGSDRSRLLMHTRDAAARSLVDGARVRVKSRVGSVEATLTVTDDVMPGVVSLPHGFGHAPAAETMRLAGAVAGPNVNALTDEERVEPVVGTSILNGVVVEVEALHA